MGWPLFRTPVVAATMAKDTALPKYDAVVSFVLFQTAASEIRAAVDQVLDSGGRLHVVLIDNSVPELDLTAFAQAEVSIVRPGANIGYGAAHNLALRKFTGQARYHFVLNTDLRFGPNVIGEMMAFMEAHPHAGLAMPRVIYPDGSLQHLCRLLPRPIDIAARALFPQQAWAKALTRRYESHDWSYDAPLNFPFLSGCFMVLRPEVLAVAGLFDERFFLFAEDLDLSRRLHRVSQTLLCPDVSVVHEYRTKTERSSLRTRYLVQSFITYFNKYGWLVDRERSAMNRRALAQLPARRGRG